MQDCNTSYFGQIEDSFSPDLLSSGFANQMGKAKLSELDKDDGHLFSISSNDWYAD